MNHDYWITFIDLLGFSTANSIGSSEAEWMIDRLLSRASKVCAHHPNIRKSWFSDTLIMYAPCDDGSFFELEYFSSTIFLELLKEGIPLRGALVRGELHNKEKDYGYRVEPSQVTFGSGIVAAYLASEKQNQIAFSVHAPIPEKAKENFAKRYVVWSEPFDSTNYERYSLLIGTLDELEIENTSAHGVWKLAIASERSNSNKKILQKYGNTIQFIRHFNRRPEPILFSYPLVLGLHSIEEAERERAVYGES